MNPLPEIIKSEIKRKGRINFAAFMELALYHPEYGYYTSGKERIGREGDFYTSPFVHAAYGQVLARFIEKASELIEDSENNIIEMGAGKCLLASDILDSMQRGDPELYDRTTYYIVERGLHSLRLAVSVLKNHVGKIRFLPSLDDLGRGGINGIVISNELVDSFPFHRLRWTRGRLREIYVTLEDGKFAEITGDPCTNELEKYFNSSEVDVKEGQEVEVNLLAGEWMKRLGRIINSGFVITIDYGYLAPELFSPERMSGTYKCIHKHTINETPYINIGEQDITSHVDFSNLIREGKSAGLEEVRYTTQGQFLIDWGILDIMENDSYFPEITGLSTEKSRAAIKSLFLPGQMGHIFKVLIQKKNLDLDNEGFYPESPLKISFGIA